MTPIRRAAGAFALVLAALVVVWLLVVLITNLGAAILGLVGLAVAAAGAWWIVTRQGARRWLGVAGAVLGLLVILASLLIVLDRVEHALLQLVLLAIVLGVGSAAVRFAIDPLVQHALPAHVRSVEPPSRPVLLCNPWSGGGKVEQFGLVDQANGLGVETRLLGPGIDLGQLARDAVAQGADCLGMAGGDGSQALVASIAVEHDLPFVCISAGTRNHFALDLGLNRDDPREGLAAFRDGLERRIDYATVNGRFFVNNVSLGVYAEIVQDDSYRDAKLDTAMTKLPQMLGATAEPFDLQFTTEDGQEVDGAFLIQVSNNPYAMLRLTEVGRRPSMHTGSLGVIAVSAATGAEAAVLVTKAATGLAATDPNLHRWNPSSFTVRSRSGRVSTGVDGEALEMDTPLRMRSHPGGLRLLVPATSVPTVTRRVARNVTPARLPQLVLHGDRALPPEAPPAGGNGGPS